ncbi:lasso peptide biosynthesis B2 protein [Streptomyces sp. H27-H5]|uniref:lasso peptide biosynthesis B2 protein n=1 Tax=Streptomyces sp. H27-H5 TaxID=2996460 RepID=UPI00226EFA56|nr:lasso peptide biosynthesis B2 protein [Streptomyces sp. H27-H5]MCY0961631.1 lasso peptide biosynthesis B2 protein [Streptomyces sp. H27-H5]
MKKHSGIYAAVGAQGVALMDVRRGRGRWRFLDPIGAQLWDRVTRGAEPRVAVEELATQWALRGVPAERVRADLTRVATDLQAAGLLTAVHRPPAAAAPPEVLFVSARPVPARRRLAAHAGLATALVLLRLLPLRWTMAVARAATRLPGRAATRAEAVAVHSAVRRAAAAWPGSRIACLEESLASFITAALTGRRMRWVLGARFSPYGAHAWTEAGGQIIGQDRDERIWPYIPALQVEHPN